MTARLFADPQFPAVPVVGAAELYPVHRIFCVGRNYEEHAKEMGDTTVGRDAPFYFIKDASTVISSGSTMAYPPGTKNLHHEIELVVYLGASLFNATQDEVEAAVYGYGVGLDMTRRDLQNAAKTQGRPWDLGKNFEQGTVLAPVTQAQDFTSADQRIWLSVDGVVRQDGRISDMVWNVAELLSDLSKYYHLRAGDIVMTGTPAGVGAIVAGQELTGGIEGLSDISLTIGAAD